MKTPDIDIDELDNRWSSFLAQDSVATNDEVKQWLLIWGTPAFQDWRKTKSPKSAAPSNGGRG